MLTFHNNRIRCLMVDTLIRPRFCREVVLFIRFLPRISSLRMSILSSRMSNLSEIISIASRISKCLEIIIINKIHFTIWICKMDYHRMWKKRMMMSKYSPNREGTKSRKLMPLKKLLGLIPSNPYHFIREMYFTFQLTCKYSYEEIA